MKLRTEDGKLNIEFLIYLFFIFLLGCLVGWVYEEIFYWITEGMLRNRGILYGPWLPIYGVGGVVIYFAKPLKKFPPVLFLVCLVATGVVEYTIGWCAIHFYDLKLWDYSGLFLNYQGIVCFRSVISFAIIGVVFHYLAEPLALKLFTKVQNRKAVYITAAVLLFLFVVDCVFSALMRTPITYA